MNTRNPCRFRLMLVAHGREPVREMGIVTKGVLHRGFVGDGSSQWFIATRLRRRAVRLARSLVPLPVPEWIAGERY